jgi:hypothetical protein
VLHHANTPTRLLERLVFTQPFAGLLFFLQRFRRLRRLLQGLLERLYATELERFKLIVVHPNVSKRCLEFFVRLGENSTNERIRGLALVAQVTLMQNQEIP